MHISRSTVVAALISPLIFTYGWLLIYPTLDMIRISFTDVRGLGDTGNFVGAINYADLLSDRLFAKAIRNTLYFLALTVIPGTLISLMLAILVCRLKGWLKGFVLSIFFIPYIIPVSAVYLTWNWMFDYQFGVLQHLLSALFGHNVPVFRRYEYFFPAVALLTIWWTSGFNILLFVAALGKVPTEIYEAAELDGAGRLRVFGEITWPLIWPVTALITLLQLLFNLKVFDQVYLFSKEGRVETTMVFVQYIYHKGFVTNQGGVGAAAATMLLIVVIAVSVFYQKVARVRRSL